MKKLKVNTGRKYEIIIDRGIINHCGEYIKKVSSPTRIAVVTDSNVHALYSQSVITSLKQSGFIVSETGNLQATGLPSLGINPATVMKYQAML